MILETTITGLTMKGDVGLVMDQLIHNSTGILPSCVGILFNRMCTLRLLILASSISHLSIQDSAPKVKGVRSTDYSGQTQAVPGTREHMRAQRSQNN